MREKDTDWHQLSLKLERRGAPTNTLCPVKALWDFLGDNWDANSGPVFVKGSDRKPCTRLQLAHLLCQVINEADPGKSTMGNHVRKMSATLAFLRTYSVTQTRDSGQWSSAQTFVDNYLTTFQPHFLCHTMGEGVTQ